MAKQNKPTFGKNTGSYYGSYEYKEAVTPQTSPVTPQTKKETPLDASNEDLEKDKPNIVKPQGQSVPLEKSVEELQKLVNLPIPAPSDEEKTLGIDYSSHKLRVWNRDKNKNALKLYKAKKKEEQGISISLDAPLNSDESAMQRNKIELSKSIDNLSEAIPEEYGYNEKIPMAIQLKMAGKFIPSLLPEEEKDEYIEKNGIQTTDFDGHNVSSRLNNTFSFEKIQNIAEETKQFEKTILDDSQIKKIDKISKVGSELDSYYKDVVLPERNKLMSENETLVEYNKRQLDFVSKQDELTNLKNTQSYKEYEESSGKHKALVEQYNNLFSQKKEEVEKAKSELDLFTSQFKENENKELVITADSDITSRLENAHKNLEVFTSKLKKDNEGKLILSNKNEALELSKIESELKGAQEEFNKDIDVKINRLSELQKNLDSAYGSDIKSIMHEINKLEGTDLMQSVFKGENSDVLKFNRIAEDLVKIGSDVDLLKEKSEVILKDYELNNPVEVKYKKDITKYGEDIKALKGDKNSWLFSLMEKYGDEITPDIINNEAIKAINNFKYNKLSATGITPPIPKKMDIVLKNILTSQEYMFGSMKDKKIMLHQYFTETIKKGSFASFLGKNEAYIYPELSAVLFTAKALELKRKSDLYKKLNPKDYGRNATAQTPIISQYGAILSYEKSNVKTESQLASEIADDILDRILNIPAEKTGIFSDFIKGLINSEAKDWIPIIGGLLDAKEKKVTYDAYSDIKNNTATFEQKRLVETLESFRSIANMFGQDGATSYNIGNKYFPQMVKFIGEIYAGTEMMSIAGKALSTSTSALTEGVKNTGNLFYNFVRYAGATPEEISIMSKLAFRPAGILLRGLVQSQTVGVGNSLAYTYDKMMPYTISKLNPETLKIEGFEARVEEFKKFSDAYLKSSLQNAVEYSTEEMGFILDKPLGYVKSSVLSSLKGSIKGWSVKSKAISGFLNMVKDKEFFDIVSRSALYKKTAELAPYITLSSGRTTIHQINSLPAETMEEVLADVFNDLIDINFGNREHRFFDNESYFNHKFVETASIMSPLAAASTLIGLSKIAYKSYHIATTENFKPDDIDLKFLDINNLSKNAIFNFGRRKRSSLKKYESIVAELKTKESPLSSEEIDDIMARIEELEKSREIALAKLAYKSLEKRVEFDERIESTGENITYSEFIDEFRKNTNLVKSVINGSLLSGDVDINIINETKQSINNDTRLSDELDNLYINYEEFRRQKEQNLLPDNITFEDFFKKGTKRLDAITKLLNNYIAGGGSVNFTQVENAIKNIPMSQEKLDEVANLLSEAKSKFESNQSITVEDVVFSTTLGASRSFTDKGREIISTAVSSIKSRLKQSGLHEMKLTHNIGVSNGMDYDIYIDHNGNLKIGSTSEEFNYDEYKKYIVENVGFLNDVVRRAIFFTLGNNTSFTQEQRLDLIKAIHDNLGEDLAENKINTTEAIKRMALLNEGLRSSNATFSIDTPGGVRTNAVLAYKFFKGNYNYDEKSKKFFLSEREFMEASSFLHAMANFDRLASGNKLKLISDKMIADNSYVYNPTEEEDDLLDSVSTSQSTTKGKRLKKSDVVKYISSLKENKNISRAQLNAIVNVIMNTAVNFKRMGIIENESDFIYLLPDIKQLQVQSTHVSQRDRVNNPNVLMQSDEVQPGKIDIISYNNAIKKALEQSGIKEQNAVFRFMDNVSRNIAKRLGISIEEYYSKNKYAYSDTPITEKYTIRLLELASGGNLNPNESEIVILGQPDDVLEKSFNNNPISKKLELDINNNEHRWIFRAIATTKLGKELLGRLGKNPNLKDLNSLIEKELSIIKERAEKTDDYYLKELTHEFIDRKIKESLDEGNSENQYMWEDIKKRKDTYIEEQRKLQRQNLVSIISYYINAHEYPLGMKIAILDNILNNDYSYDFREKKYSKKTRQSNTIGLHYSPSSLFMNGVISHALSGNALMDDYFYEAINFKEDKLDFSKYKNNIHQETSDGTWYHFSNDKVGDNELFHEMSKLSGLHNGSWCTGGSQGTADSYLERGDMYIFFSSREKLPTVQLHVDDNKAIEIGGTLIGQGLHEEDIETVEEFQNTNKNIDLYEIRNYNTYSKLLKKWNKHGRNHGVLTTEEKKFLYHTEKYYKDRTSNLDDFKNGLSEQDYADIFNVKVEDVYTASKYIDLLKDGIINENAVIIGDLMIKDDGFPMIFQDGVADKKIFKHCTGSVRMDNLTTVNHKVFDTAERDVFMNNLKTVNHKVFDTAERVVRMDNLTTVNHKVFDTAGGVVRMDNLETVNSKVFDTAGDVYMDNLETVNSKVFDTAGDVYMNNLETVNSKVFDTAGRYVRMDNLKTVNHKVFDTAGGVVRMDNLKTVNHKVFDTAGGVVRMDNLTTVNHKVFDTAGGVYMDNLETVNSKVFDTAERDVFMNNLETVNSKVFDTAGGVVYMNDNAKSKIIAISKGESDILFQDKRGVILLGNNNNSLTVFSKKSDITTIIHEKAHEYERVLTEDEVRILEEWSKYKFGSTEFSEAFAKGAERVLYEGTFGNDKVRNIFNKFKEWFKRAIGNSIDYFSDINEMNYDVLDIYRKMMNNKASDIVSKESNLKQEDADSKKVKGLYNPIENIIIILKEGDVSTVMHELGHAFRFMLQEAADNGNVAARQKLDTFHNFIMSKEGKKWFDENIKEGEYSINNYKFVNEFWARSFERYLRDGSYGMGIKDIGFKNLLNEFKDWMSDIYESIKKGVLDIKLSKEMKLVFEDIIGNKIDIDKDLLSYIKDKFGRFSTRTQYKKEDVFALIEKAKEGIDPAIEKEVLAEIHRIIDAYKKQIVAQRYRGNSKLYSKELRFLMVTKRHVNLDYYIDDLKNVDKIISDSKYRFSIMRSGNLRSSARDRALSKIRENVLFYSKLKELASINLKSIGSIEVLDEYNKLLRAKPEDFGDSFVKMADLYIDKSNRYKNDVLLAEEEAGMTSSDLDARRSGNLYTPSEESIATTRRLKIDALKNLRDYVVNVSNVDTIKDKIQVEFFSADISQMTDTELSEYGVLLNSMLRTDYENTLLQLDEFIELNKNSAIGNSKDSNEINVLNSIAKATLSKLGVNLYIDAENLSDEAFDRYKELIMKLGSDNTNSAFNFNKDFVDFTVKFISRIMNNKIEDGVTQSAINTMHKLNSRWHNKIPYLRVFLNRLIFPFSYGMAEYYNMKDYLNFFDGISEDYSGAMVSNIFNPLEEAKNKHREIISSVFKKVNDFKNHIGEGGFNRVGIAWLLNQKPDIAISEDMFKNEIDEETGEDIPSLIERLGLDKEAILSEIGMTLNADEFFEKDKNGVWAKKDNVNNDRFELYEKLLNDRMRYVVDSILLSFGEKPSGMSDIEFNSHIEERVSNPLSLIPIANKLVIDVNTGKSNAYNILLSDMQNKKAMLLKGTGFTTVGEYLSSGIILNDKESEFMNTGISLFDMLNSGHFSDGVTMREMSENYTGEARKFVEIKNYAPVIRYLTSTEDTKNMLSLEPGVASDEDSFFTFRTGVNISNNFVKTRKRNVSTLETNAFNMIEKRFDQELFYMLNEPHRLVLRSLFDRKDSFMNKIDTRKDDSNIVTKDDRKRTSKNYIRNQISLYYRRGISPAKTSLGNSKFWSKISRIQNDFRIAILAPIRSSFAQITSTVLSQGNMLGGAEGRLQDMAMGYSDLFSDSDIKEEFLRKYAPEVYYRGLTDYDLGGNREALNVSSAYSNYYNNNFSSELGVFNELFRSFKNNNLAIEKAMLPLVYLDKAAARASFFALYRNYCNHYGIDVDFNNPNEEAINFALSGVRRTQNTDNELYKSGVLSGISSHDGGVGFFEQSNSPAIAPAELFRQSYWNFKSFSLADQNNIAIKFAKAMHFDSDNEGFGDVSTALVYNILGKMAFNYVKSYSAAWFTGLTTFIAYMLNMGYTGDDEHDSAIRALIDGDLDEVVDRIERSAKYANKNINNKISDEITSSDGRDNALSGIMYNATKALISEFQINSISGVLAGNLARGIHQSSIEIEKYLYNGGNIEIGERMEKLYSFSDETDLLGLYSKVFGVSLVFGNGGKSHSILSGAGNAVADGMLDFDKQPEDMSYSDITSAWFFVSQALGLGLFGRMPLSYPAIKKATEDIDRVNRESMKSRNESIRTIVEPEEDENDDTDEKNDDTDENNSTDN